MEFLNKIEVQGVVGNTHTQVIGSTRSVRFSLLTEEVYKSSDGTPVVESTWFNCTAFEGEAIKDTSIVVKGAWLHITGRLKVIRYTDASSRNISIYEVICKTIEKIED